MQKNRVFNMLPIPPKPTWYHVCREEKKPRFLILTGTGKKPKPKNQISQTPKHGMRNIKRPHPHKENKTHTDKILNQPEFSHKASHKPKTKIIGENRLKRVVSSIDKKNN